jgi:predicted transposase YbfD/YdcC
VAALTKTPADLIAIAGKTSPRSGKKGAKKAIHMVSAFAARQRLVLAQTKVDVKSNEIQAIPALLDLLSIEGAVVTIEAMGCQRDIGQKIIDKKADYILVLRGNQPTLREDVELFANEQKAKGFSDTTTSAHKTVDGHHGRIETRRATVVHDVAWPQERHDWSGLQGVVVIESIREIGARTERETRYYLTSSVWQAERLGPMVRDHWAVENGLHWVMDMTFRHDERRIRTEHAPENFVTLKHMAAIIARRAPGRDSVRLRFKTAAWDDDYLAKLITA